MVQRNTLSFQLKLQLAYNYKTRSNVSAFYPHRLVFGKHEMAFCIILKLLLFSWQRLFPDVAPFRRTRPVCKYYLIDIRSTSQMNSEMIIKLRWFYVHLKFYNNIAFDVRFMLVCRRRNVAGDFSWKLIYLLNLKQYFPLFYIMAII